MIRPYSLDKPLAAVVAKLPKSVTPAIEFGSFIAAPIPIACILFVLVSFSLLTQNYDLLKMSLMVIVASPIAEISKFITRRKRPESLYVEQMRFKTYSFPSGHSYIAMLVFGFLAFTLMGAGLVAGVAAIGLLLLVGLVGVSRIYLGAHFPSDVIAGWTLGGVIVTLIFMYTDALL